MASACRACLAPSYCFWDNPILDFQKSVDEDHFSVGGVVEVYPLWDFSEQDLYAWFHNGKLVLLGVIIDGVFIPNTAELENVGDDALIKIHCPTSFKGSFLHDPDLPRVTMNHNVVPPGVAYIIYQLGFYEHVCCGLIVQQDPHRFDSFTCYLL